MSTSNLWITLRVTLLQNSELVGASSPIFIYYIVGICYQYYNCILLPDRSSTIYHIGEQRWDLLMQKYENNFVLYFYFSPGFAAKFVQVINRFAAVFLGFHHMGLQSICYSIC